MNVALEIDGAVVEIGRSEPALPDKVDVVVGDARVSLRDLGTGSADVVVGDAFTGRAVPWHLTTREFNEDIARVLKPDGLYAMNIVDNGEFGFLRAAIATLDEVFLDVVLFARNDDDIATRRGGNFVIAASDSVIDLEGALALIRDGDGLTRALSGAELDRFVGNAQILVDDFAPVDQLLGRR